MLAQTSFTIGVTEIVATLSLLTVIVGACFGSYLHCRVLINANERDVTRLLGRIEVHERVCEERQKTEREIMKLLKDLTDRVRQL